MQVTAELMSLLAAQQELLTRLLALASEERSCFTEPNPMRLTAITNEQGTLLAAQVKLSSRATNAMRRILGASAPEKTICLSDLAPHLNARDGQMVATYAKNLARAMDELQHQVRINWYLSQQALKFVDYTIKVIGREMEGQLPYMPTTQPGQSKSVRFLMDASA